MMVWHLTVFMVTPGVVLSMVHHSASADHSPIICQAAQTTGHIMLQNIDNIYHFLKMKKVAKRAEQGHGYAAGKDEKNGVSEHGVLHQCPYKRERLHCYKPLRLGKIKCLSWTLADINLMCWIYASKVKIKGVYA